MAAALGGETAPSIARRIVVYAGPESQERSAGTLLSWTDLDRLDLGTPLASQA
ncbi:MAG TPA: hypothetical protein VGE98_04660 [Thermoanaerobaculia bacterium]